MQHCYTQVPRRAVYRFVPGEIMLLAEQSVETTGRLEVTALTVAAGKDRGGRDCEPDPT